PGQPVEAYGPESKKHGIWFTHPGITSLRFLKTDDPQAFEQAMADYARMKALCANHRKPSPETLDDFRALVYRILYREDERDKLAGSPVTPREVDKIAIFVREYDRLQQGYATY